MNFSEIFIKKPVMSILLTVALLLFGIGAYLQLPISDLPSVDSPVINISVSYPGASPELMASAVATPLENECMKIPGLMSIISDNSESDTEITLSFDLSRNVDLAAPDVLAAIQRAQSNLPKDLPNPPSYAKKNPSDTPIIYILVKSDTLKPSEVYDIANKRIAQRISMINGVSDVGIWGSKGAVRVQVSPDKLAAFNIGIDDVSAAIKTGTVNIPGGSLNGIEGAYNIDPQGQLFRAAQYDRLIIKYKDGAPVRLGDVGKAIDGIQVDVTDTNFYSNKDKKLNRSSVVIQVRRQPGSNTVFLSDSVKKLLKDLKPELPGSIDVEVLYDRARTIIDSINDVKSTLFQAFILVVLVIFLFLARVSDTVIPAVALPISVISTFLAMYLCGFSLDNLSLMAITLAIGFVVDDAIVVLENTVRLIEEGDNPFTAAVKSAKDITGTVVSMTLSLVTVFIPLVFMGGIVGRSFREFALTVIFAVVCSGIISLTLTPMMCARMLKPGSKAKNPMQKTIEFFVSMLISGYGKILKFVLKRKYVSISMWMACLGGTFYVFTLIPQSFMPLGDSGLVKGSILLPLGCSTAEMQRFQETINDILREDPNIHHFSTSSGQTPGADQTSGSIVICLKPLEQRKPISEVVKDLRVKLNNSTYPIGSVFIQAMPVLRMSTGGESTASGDRYSYVLSGTNMDDVNKSALLLEERLRSTRGFTDIQNTVKLAMPKLKLKILRDRASSLGLTAYDIESALSVAYAQGKVTQFNTQLDQYYVILEASPGDRAVPADLSKLYVRSSKNGQIVPLSSVAKWEMTVGPQSVYHSQQLNSSTVSFNLEPDIPIGVATKELSEILADVTVPGVMGAFQGEAKQFMDAVSSMPLLITIAIFLMYVILGVLYESYIHPFTVLTTLPVAAFGGLLTLFVFNSELSIYAYVGMFMLLGIVAKNGIMMVDFANRKMEEEDKSSFEAIYEASLVRFRPILMTGLAAIMGAVPIALGFGAGGDARRPLGLIIVGGLIFSQIITLFVTPGIFLVMQFLQEKVLDRFELSRSASARKKTSAVENKA